MGSKYIPYTYMDCLGLQTLTLNPVNPNPKPKPLSSDNVAEVSLSWVSLVVQGAVDASSCPVRVYSEGQVDLVSRLIMGVSRVTT